MWPWFRIFIIFHNNCVQTFLCYFLFNFFLFSLFNILKFYLLKIEIQYSESIMGDDIKRFKLREEKHTVAEIELMAWSPTMDLLALANVNGEVSFIINLPACLYAHYIFLSFQFFFLTRCTKKMHILLMEAGIFCYPSCML